MMERRRRLRHAASNPRFAPRPSRISDLKFGTLIVVLPGVLWSLLVLVDPVLVY